MECLQAGKIAILPRTLELERIDMPPSNPNQPGAAWLVFALLTVASWGVYGVFLHAGQSLMKDTVNGRYKAFLFVGIAYFITAVLAPLLILWWKGASWDFTPKGMTWSLLAGTVGAAGAFCVLLAFGAGGMPSVVMAIIFAGAPIVNAIVALTWHPPAGGLANIRWQFVAGIVLAAVGGCMVTLYKPPPGKTSHAAPPANVEAVD
jgi:drug/metabolite transporter (DMT)-like permease